ncbi:nucleoside hydrolase [Sphaerisporangium melleum]|uniref:Nucleoside hydrolase n=1 Tax=Sphaerisporangium melleum TaxID=321316 RepID=A0A917R546_9ACTN|nr:nucleoside hydrolase [Sphaerisporangium melleum]GGK89759.1 nucleoside hydrolase [Sphaerisporangium melleum]GII72536.1 nucleoside hydrolase [Sphaerisporangium melleum]
MTGPAAARRVIVDTDAGIDDACALAYLAGRADAEISAVTTVAGNCAEPDVARNVGYVLRLLGLSPPVARGAAGPLPGAPAAPRGTHGRDGLGDLGLSRPLPAVTGESAAALLVRLAAERPGELDLLALGPLTNLALALRADPALLTKYRSVVVMGGSGPLAAPAAPLPRDSNIARDPAAARAVFAAPRRRLAAVGVDVTATATLPPEAIAALAAAGTPVARFTAEILTAYLAAGADRGRGGVPLHDPLAAGVLLDPGLVTGFVLAPVAVVADGPLWRARPAPVRREGGPAPDTRVVTQVDAPWFVRGFVRTLTGDVRHAGPG